MLDQIQKMLSEAYQNLLKYYQENKNFHVNVNVFDLSIGIAIGFIVGSLFSFFLTRQKIEQIDQAEQKLLEEHKDEKKKEEKFKQPKKVETSQKEEKQKVDEIKNKKSSKEDEKYNAFKESELRKIRDKGQTKVEFVQPEKAEENAQPDEWKKVKKGKNKGF